MLPSQPRRPTSDSALHRAALRCGNVALVGVLAFALTSCGEHRSLFGFIYEPPLNQNPVQILRVTGSIDPSLRLTLKVIYTTNVSWCRRTLNWLDGAEQDGFKLAEYRIQAASSRYEAQIHLDRYQPGSCKWAAQSLAYSVQKDNVTQVTPLPPTPVVWFKNDAASSLPPLEIHCLEGTWSKKNGLACVRQKGAPHLVSAGARSISIDFREVSRRSPGFLF